MSERKSSAYWGQIPAPVRYDDRIPASSKLLYAEITARISDDGYCEAENADFARLYRITEKSVREQLHALQDAGYIRIEEKRGDHNALLSRRIYAGLNPLSPPEEPLNENVQRGGAFERKRSKGGPLNEKVQPLNEKVQRHFIKNNNIYPPISPKLADELDKLPAEAAALLLDYVGDDAETQEDLADFVEQRRLKRAPIKTARTVELLLGKLQELGRGSRERERAILEQSIERGWTGLFDLKDDPAPEGAGATGGYWAPDPEA